MNMEELEKEIRSALRGAEITMMACDGKQCCMKEVTATLEWLLKLVVNRDNVRRD